MILTGVGIPLAIPLKLASVAALSAGAGAIAAGLGGATGGAALAYRNREKGVKCAARLFSKELQKQERLAAKSARKADPPSDSGRNTSSNSLDSSASGTYSLSDHYPDISPFAPGQYGC